MSSNLTICSLDEGLKQKLRKFRFRKANNNAAIVMKIDKESRKVVEDVIDEDEQYMQDISLEDLAAELPAHQPRYIAYSYCYKHDDGRVSYPLCFIFISPQGSTPEQQMMYAGSKMSLVRDGEFTKVFELRDYDEMTEEWLISKLGFFR